MLETVLFWILTILIPYKYRLYFIARIVLIDKDIGMMILETYHETSNTRRTLAGNKSVHHTYIVGASSVGAAPTTSSLST